MNEVPRICDANVLGNEDRTDYQSWRVGSQVNIKRQGGDGASQEQDTVGNHF